MNINSENLDWVSFNESFPQPGQVVEFRYIHRGYLHGYENPTVVRLLSYGLCGQNQIRKDILESNYFINPEWRKISEDDVDGYKGYILEDKIHGLLTGTWHDRIPIEDKGDEGE